MPANQQQRKAGVTVRPTAVGPLITSLSKAPASLPHLTDGLAPSSLVKVTRSNCSWPPKRLPPDTAVTFLSDSTCFLCPPLEEDAHCVVELRWSYRREQDGTVYDTREFFFLNPEGRWVSRFDGSLPDSIYGPVKDAVLSSDWRIPEAPARPAQERQSEG